MRVLAPAKINLTLSIVGKRPDWFHALESVMQMLSLADEILIDNADELLFSCSDPALITEDNLVLRAARALQQRSQIPRGARIHLEKRIPYQAGLGGGSSDAASTLAALNEFWEIRLTPDDLVQLATELGSDVPFFLDGPCAVVRGRGEIVKPVVHATPCHIVLAKPSFGLPTAQVYGSLHARPTSPGDEKAIGLPETQAMVHALQTGNIDALLRALTNDLEGPALTLMPELFPLRERMLEEGCLGVLLCGSGSALFGICETVETAQSAAKALRNDFPWTWSGTWLLFR